MNIGIIGCGTAGAAAALFLSRVGHRITLYEAVPNPEAIGAGIMLQPIGQQVLAELHLLDPILERGNHIDRLLCSTAQGKPIFDLNYKEFQPDFFGVGLHRGVLFETLFKAISDSSVTLQCSTTITSILDSFLIDIEGKSHGPYDLIIVADGARSQLRNNHIKKSARLYPWGVLWFVANDPEQRFTGILKQVVDGPDRMLGLLPTGKGPHTDTPLCSLFWSVREDRLDAWKQAGLQAWKREFLSYVPQADYLLDQIQDIDQILFARYFDVRMFPWHQKNVVYLGDAAHGMSPHLGQGANLALYDAWVLAQCLNEFNIDAALAMYSQQRRAHLRFYQYVTRWLTPLFQSDMRSLAWFRDTIMSHIGKMPFFHRQMVKIMAGLAP